MALDAHGNSQRSIYSHDPEKTVLLDIPTFPQVHASPAVFPSTAPLAMQPIKRRRWPYVLLIITSLLVIAALAALCLPSMLDPSVPFKPYFYDFLPEIVRGWHVIK